MGHLLPLAAAVLAISASSLAQEFNVDLGSLAGPVPSAAFGAAAGQPGVWNAMQTGGALVDTSGAPTSVTLALVDLGYVISRNEACTSGDVAALLDDLVWDDAPAGGALVFSGLADGPYTVYTYAMAPEDPDWVTRVRVVGSPETSQLVGGDFCAGFWKHSTHAVHDVVVAGGSLRIEVTEEVDYLSVNGVQIVAGAGHDGSVYCACLAGAPCSNEVFLTGGCENSTGLGAHLLVGGSPSVSIDDLRLRVAFVPASRPALLFAGLNALNGGAGLAFGDGLRCVGGSVVRLGTQPAGANGSALWGPGLAPQGGWQGGDTRRFQVWYRDPAGPCGSGFNLSDAYELTFVP